MKNLFQRTFEPAIQFLNRYPFPRKFAITGTLVVLPLVFVTWQYMAMLNHGVELSQEELAGNHTIRQLVPLWRSLREFHLATIVASSQDQPRHDDSLAGLKSRVESLLSEIVAADAEHKQLQYCSRWNTFRAKLRILLDSDSGVQPMLAEPAVVSDLIEDFRAVMRQVADISTLSVDPHPDSQHLSISIASLIPDLIDTEDRLREQIAQSVRDSDQQLLDLKLAEFNGGINVIFDRVNQNLNLAMLNNGIVRSRISVLLMVARNEVRRIASGIRQRHFQADDAPSLGELDSLAGSAIRESVALLVVSQDAFEECVELRTHQARMWRWFLLLAAMAPLTLASYLVIGLCMAIVQTSDRMRDVTEKVLSEDRAAPLNLAIDAQDELGRMIDHFGRLASRLREEWASAHAEAVRASQAEESLRVNQERFNLVLQGANDGIWDWDLQTDRVFYSDRFKELLGHENGEFDVWLSALADILHPDDFDMTWRAVERHFHDREPYHIEHRLRTKGGEYRWFLERGQAVWDENGVPIRMAGSIKDITTRKATEARERVRNRVLELLAAGASLAEVLEPLVRSVEAENSQLRGSILLLDKERKRLQTSAAPNLPEFYTNAINGVEIGMGVGSCGTAAFLGQRVIVEDISTHPYWLGYRELAARAGLAACWSEPIRDKSGAVLGTFAIYGSSPGTPTESDIRLIEVAANLAGIAIERKQVETALRESEERWKFALEGAGDGVWDWNIQSGEVVFSRRWAEMLGFEEHELDNTMECWRNRIYTEDLPAVLSSLQDYLDGKTVTYTHEHRMVCKNGNVKWILSRGIIVSCDASGAALRMIGTHSDITDRKRMEEDSHRYLQQVEASRDRITEQSIQLIRQSEELARARDQAEAAARAKSEFLANMSHELRTPLTAILGYADLIYDAEGEGTDNPHRETIDIIRNNGRHLQELIDDILDLSKIEADRMTLELAEVSPRKLVDDVLHLMQLRAQEKGLDLQTEYLFPMPKNISTDALRVRQILVNLIGNAIKFTERGNIRITVRYDEITERQIFSVTDSGIGIKPEQLERLFTPFSQADASMSRRFGGTGLGLSISKRLAQMLGGDISASSTFGVGSEFTLEIAAGPETDLVMAESEIAVEPATPACPVVTAPMKLSGRILLAEDVLANQKLIAFLLQKWGAVVQVVDNGLLAVNAALLASAAAEPFDLILMDIQMPEMDGYTATATLRRQGYTGKIIALTAHASDDDRDRCLSSGFDSFAVKPIQKDQLYAVCREQLELSFNARQSVVHESPVE